MYDKILIATDGSEVSERAVQQGLALAKALGATATAVFVVDTRVVPGAHPIVPESMAPYYFSLVEELRKSATSVLDRVRQDAEAMAVQIETEVVDGVPATAILEIARKSGAKLIVMGTHGRTGIAALVMGSTAQALLHNAEVPVLLVR